MKSKFHVGCMVCSPKDPYFVVTSVDGLCEFHRKQQKEVKVCAGCKIDYDGSGGWLVPGFVSYSDINYYCPTCIKKGQSDYQYKQRRIRQNTREKEIVMRLLGEYKYNSRGSRFLKEYYEHLSYEYNDLLFPGSGWNPKPNT